MPAACWCRSLCPIHQVYFQWTVHNFSLRPSEPVRSPEFWGGSLPSVRWVLTVYPRGQDEGSSEWVSVYVGTASLPARARYRVSLIDRTGRECFTLDTGRARSFLPEGNGWGARRYVERSVLESHASSWLPHDLLTLYCRLEVLGDLVTEDSREDRISKLFAGPDCLPALSEELRAILDLPPDVVFSVQGEEVEGHEAVLSARSSVLKDMFRHAAGPHPYRVQVRDVEPQAFRAMVQFLQSGLLPPLNQTLARGLLRAATKHRVEPLQTAAQRWLLRALTPGNCLQMLVLADVYDARQLRAEALDVATTAPGIRSTPGWGVLASHPHLLQEVVEGVVVAAHSAKRSRTD